MNIIVSNSLDVPLYIQIKEQIKEAILKGELEDGELLPSIRNFANDVHVSVLTIRRVYDELEKEGFAFSQAQGNFCFEGQSGTTSGFQTPHHRTGFTKGCS